MRVIRILGVLFVLIGIALFFTSNYIAVQVVEGKSKIASAQSQVDQTNSIFSLNPIAKEVGKGFTDSAQQQINAGNQEVSAYEVIASRLYTGAIALVVLGVVFFVLSFFGKRKR